MGCDKDEALGAERLTRRVTNAVLASTTPKVEFKPGSDKPTNSWSTATDGSTTSVLVTNLVEAVGETAAAIKTISSVTQDLDGAMSALYTLEVSAGGVVTGYTSSATPAGSEFIVKADKFGVESQSGAVKPFVVTASGVSIGTDVSINGNLVVDGTITTESIALGAVSDVGSFANGSVISIAANERVVINLIQSLYVENVEYSSLPEHSSVSKIASFPYPIASAGFAPRQRQLIGTVTSASTIIYSAYSEPFIWTQQGPGSVTIAALAVAGNIRNNISGTYIKLKR